uniref:Ionotropic receptor n=1 Tax=Anopheles gambiae TaxID=7165 RepID=A0A2Y9D2D3_ANOGA
MKQHIRLFMFSFLASRVVCEHFVTEAFLIARRVVDRLEREQTHDILCVNCNEQVFEDVVTRLQNERPYVALRRITLVSGTINILDSMQEMHRKPSLVLQCCTNGTYCHWGESFWYSNPNKYSIYIQLFHGVDNTHIIKYGSELKRGGIIKVLQFVAPSKNHTKARVYVTGALVEKRITVSNDSDAENRLFDGTLTNYRNFVYEVGIVPMLAHVYRTGNNFRNLEISAFLTILEKQGAKYRFHREIELNKLLHKMLSGKMHVLLNPVETSKKVFEVAYWKDIQEYCIVLPRRYERMHLQLLLSPFKWQIWLVIVVILVAIQVVSFMFPERVPSYLILKCFFGGGEPEHSLATGNRLIVCVICVLIFLLTETYQAILLSLMSADPFEKNPETVNEFIEQNQTLIITKRANLPNLLPAKLEPLLKEVDQMDVDITLQNASIVSCDLAHFLNTNPYEWSLPVKADLIVIKPRVYYRMKHIIFSWTCPAVRDYQRYMDIMYDVGLYHRQLQIWFPKKMYIRREQTFNDLIVLTDDLIPVWELLGTGLSVSLACFIAEILVSKLKKV